MIFITVYKINPKLLKIAAKKYAFVFSDSENLTKAVLCLIKSGKKLPEKSFLYNLKGKYILIIEGATQRSIRIIDEFSTYKTDNTVKIELINEYGTQLIKNNAIINYGVAFLKN